jgi:hypothetical protein
MPPTYFPTPDAFRTWLTQHHASATERIIGVRRSVDEARLATLIACCARGERLP